MRTYFKHIILVFTLISFNFYSCSKEELPKENNGRFGIFKVLNDSTAQMNGVITGKTPKSFNNLISKYPKIKFINMLDCPGSDDDEANLVVSKQMHDKGISFHLLKNSEIASGAVDMYVGGIKRTREAGSKIGVHSWGADRGDPIATSYPKGHAVHLPYINYYISVGFSKVDAEAFYYFTINAATADNIHWMTDEEIKQYKIITIN